MSNLRCLPLTTVLASLLLGSVARAEPLQLLPTRDVDITYDVTLLSQPRVRERVRWLAADLLERVDGPHKIDDNFYPSHTRDYPPLVGKPHFSPVGDAATAGGARAGEHTQAW